MSGPEGSSNKHCIVCAVGIFCPEHSTIARGQRRRKSALFFTFFYLTAEGRRIQRELHLSHIEKLHTYHMYVTKARKMSKSRTLSEFSGDKTRKRLKCRIIGHIMKWNSWAIQAERWKQNKGWRICGRKGCMQSFCLSCL